MTGKVRKKQNMKDVASFSTGCKEQSNFTEADRKKLRKIYDICGNVENLDKASLKSTKKPEEKQLEN